MGRTSLRSRAGSLAAATTLALTLTASPAAAAPPPQLLADIKPGADSSEPQALTRSGDQVFFVANDGTHGRELWVTDGTTGGTHLVRDIRVGAKSSHPGGNPVIVDRPQLVDLNGTLFFTANDGTRANGVWRSDGTAAGTRFVANAPTRVYDMVARGTKVLYLAGGLWATNGTTTSLLKDAALGARGMWRVGGKVFFVMDRHLWKTDGTKAGTIQLSSHTFDNNPGEFVAAGSKVTFTESADAEYLWVTDGTVAGTHRVKPLDIENSLSGGVAITGRALYLSGRIGPIDQFPQLWASTGTKLGTRMVKEWADGHRIEAISVGGNGWVGVNGPTAGGFWATDGTAAGTTKELGSATLAPRFLAAVGSSIWFCGDNGTLDPAPMSFSTTMLQVDPRGDLTCGLPYGGVPEITPLGSRVILIAYGESDGGEIWAIADDA